MLYLLCRKIPCRVAVTLNFGLIDSTNLFHLNWIRSMPKTTINRIAQTSRMNEAKPERTLSEHNRKTRCCLCLRSKSDWVGSASVYQRPPAIHKLDDVVLRHGKPAEEKTRKSSLSYIKRERKALAKLGRCCTDDTGVVVDVVVVSRVGWCVILVLVGAVAVWPLLLPLYCVLDKPCSQCANNRKRPARVPMPKFRSDGSKRCTTMDGGGGGIYRPMSLSYKTGSPCQCVQPNDDRR